MLECNVPFWGTVTLTSDLVSRFIVFGAYLLVYLGMNPKFGVWVRLGMTECHIPFLATVTLTSDLFSKIIVWGAYLLYYLR